MFTTHGHQIPGTIAKERPVGMQVARCGGPMICNVCKDEAAVAQSRMNPGQVKMEDRPEMLSEGGFIEEAKLIVQKAFYHDYMFGEDPLPLKDIYVVWFAKTLQNWKAIVSTNVRDDRIYEVTYNGDKKETYLDAYVKHSNTVIPD